MTDEMEQIPLRAVSTRLDQKKRISPKRLGEVGDPRRVTGDRTPSLTCLPQDAIKAGFVPGSLLGRRGLAGGLSGVKHPTRPSSALIVLVLQWKRVRSSGDALPALSTRVQGFTCRKDGA